MKNKLAINSFANFGQSFLVAILLFYLYRVINFKLGINNLGIWSLVVASISISRLVDFGFSSAITFHIAKEMALNKFKKAAITVETAMISIFLFSIVFLFFFYFISNFLFQFFFHGVDLVAALDLLPFVLISLLLNIMASFICGALDGCHKILERSIIVICSQLLMLITAFYFIDEYGLKGLAFAQIFQGLFMAIISWLFLIKHLKYLNFLPKHFNKLIFFDLFKYGANIQVAGISMIFFDPLTKFFLAKYGGISAAGYYDVASQIVTRVRSLIISANQAVIPYIASSTAHGNVKKISGIYIRNLKFLSFILIPLFLTLFFSGNLFSLAIFGVINNTFLILFYVCLFSWFINTFVTPYYFINLGTSEVILNTYAFLIISSLNFFLSLCLGKYYGFKGIIFSFSSSLIIGSLYLFYASQKKHRIPISLSFFYEIKFLTLKCFVIFIINLFFQFYSSNTLITVIFNIICICIVFFITWMHPLRFHIFNLLNKSFK